MLENGGWTVRDYASCEAFLADWTPEREGCLLVDALLPGMGGIDLLKTLPQRGAAPPAVMITGAGDVAMAMAAMREGALDFIEKPVRPAALLASLTNAAARLDRLTPRERQVMALVLDGRANNLIVADLGISQRTVENHRAAVMRKTEAGSLPGLAWLALAAAKAGG